MGTYQYIRVCLAKENVWKIISEEKFTLPQENKPLKFGMDIYDCMKSWHIFFLSNEFIGKMMKNINSEGKKLKRCTCFAVCWTGVG